MPLTDDEMTVVRSYVGPTESDATLNERYDRLGTIDLAIEESLRSQLAVLRAAPASVRLPSGLSVNNSNNIEALQKALDKFIANGGTSGVAGVTRIVRTDYR